MSIALPRLYFGSRPVLSTAAVVLLVAGLLVLLPWLWIDLGRGSGVIVFLPLVVAACAFVSLRSLMPAALVLVVLSVDALGIFGDHGGEDLPYLQVLAGVRLTIRDALLAGVLPLSLLRLSRRHELPVFTRPLLIVLAAIGVAFLLGVVRDGDLKSPVNALRPLFAYALYPILVAAIDSRRKLSWLIGTIFCLAMLAVVIQLVESARGSPLPFLAPPLGAVQAASGVSVDGRNVPYIANRATWHLLITLFLCLGCLLEGRAIWRHAWLALACGMGFAVLLIRSWYIFIGVGILVLLVLQPRWSRRVNFIALLCLGGLVLGGLASGAADLTARNYGGSFVLVWLARVQTLLSFQQDQSYQVRLGELAQQWQAVAASPVLGYGLSADAQSLVRLGNLDTGAINTLVMFGVLGTMAFAGLILSAIWASLRLVRRLPACWERGYALGLVGLWAGVLVVYAFNYDLLTYTQGPWLVVLALVVADRLERLPSPANTRFLPVQSATQPIH